MQDQKKMMAQIEEYSRIKDSDASSDIKRREFLLTALFSKMDLIIKGMISAPQYNFWKYAEYDDLFQEARLAVLVSLSKDQYAPEKGSVFNFFSTVVANNLKNFTTSTNKRKKDFIFQELGQVNSSSMMYDQNYDKEIIVSETFNVLKKFFSGKQKFIEIIDLLARYYEINKGTRFIKKDFIQYANAFGYSAALVNTFFNMCVRLRHQTQNQNIKQLNDLLGILYE